jgi:hypothetical protein
LRSPKCLTARAPVLAKTLCMMTSDTKRRPARSRRARIHKAEAEAATEIDAVDSTPRLKVLDDYMDTEQLATELDVVPLTLIRWRLQKTGPPITRLGRRILYRRSSVQAWLAAREQKWA